MRLASSEVPFISTYRNALGKLPVAAACLAGAYTGSMVMVVVWLLSLFLSFANSILFESPHLTFLRRMGSSDHRGAGERGSIWVIRYSHNKHERLSKAF